MNLQRCLLDSMKREMDARTAAIVAASDLCFEADALEETLQEAGLDVAAAIGHSAFNQEGADVRVAVTFIFAKGCDVLQAIFQADLDVADVVLGPVIGPAIGSNDSSEPLHEVRIRFNGLDVELSGYLTQEDARTIFRAFKPDPRESDLIGRSILTEEVPA